MFQFVHSGSTLLDLKLGGGYALGRMTHIVGDPSTGKTQLAIEAAASFIKQYGQGFVQKEDYASPQAKVKKPVFDKDGHPVRAYQVMYCDAEAAFDLDYAEALNFPVDDVQFVEAKDPGIGITLEDFSAAINDYLDTLPDNVPGIFILDSLDSLPTLKEATTPMEDRGGYGTEKAKELGIMFRTVCQKLQAKNVLFLCISQTRDNVSGYGPKKIFSGGNAPKFYASQRVMLKRDEVLKKVIGGKEYIYGVKIEATIDKNKIGAPYGSCTFDIIFSGGIDNLNANIEFLFESGNIKLLPEKLWKMSSGTECKQKNIPLDRIKEIEDPEERKQMINAVSVAVCAYHDEIKKQLEQFKPLRCD